MANKRSKYSELYDKTLVQLDEDREKLSDIFDDLRSKTTDDVQYAANGQTLAKLAEIKIKQTSQLIELIKIHKKSQDDEDDNLDENEIENIKKELKKVV